MRDDLLELERDIKKMEKFPTTYLTGAVKKGAKLILLATKANAPKEKTRNLVSALVMITEKSKTNGKRVAQITYDRAYNEKLVKVSKDGKRSYYPASQEYGFIMRNGQKKEGKHFMRNSMIQTEGQFSNVVINDMMKRIEKTWAKKG
jgi:HK97 gp10 family phage protein